VNGQAVEAVLNRALADGYESRKAPATDYVPPFNRSTDESGKIGGLHAISQFILFAIYDPRAYFVAKFYHPMCIFSARRSPQSPPASARVPLADFWTFAGTLLEEWRPQSKHGISSVTSANYRVKVVRMVWPVFAQKPIRSQRDLIRDRDSRPCWEICPFSESGHRDRQNREPRS
jgi:hypothetical protein